MLKVSNQQTMELQRGGSARESGLSGVALRAAELSICGADSRESTLTLDFNELEDMLDERPSEGLSVVLEGVQGEIGEALFGAAAERRLRELAAFSCDGTNTYVTFGAVVPEPATATLSLLALAVLAARRRRR